MIKIAERLNVQAQIKTAAGEERAAATALLGPGSSESQDDDRIAVYPAQNLVLDRGRYYPAHQKK